MTATETVARPAAEAVRLRSVTKIHATGSQAAVTALDDVTLGFARGTFTAVMGPSGSGKSTLLHCAAGLDRPTSGDIVIDGVGLAPLSETELTLLRRDRVGFVFQAFNLVSALTAEQNVALPCRLAGRRPGRAELGEALARVGLTGRGGHRPSELSGGERQRVAIARALIAEPAVLFADEPTGSLDSVTSRGVLDLLRGLVDGRGQTVIMVTHDPVVAAFSDRVLLLSDGRVVDELTGPLSADAIAARMMERSC
jgi:putative ABC transport system ATP-binding protein